MKATFQIAVVLNPEEKKTDYLTNCKETNKENVEPLQYRLVCIGHFVMLDCHGDHVAEDEEEDEHLEPDAKKRNK